jgi:hypothetical protein
MIVQRRRMMIMLTMSFVGYSGWEKELELNCRFQRDRAIQLYW